MTVITADPALGGPRRGVLRRLVRQPLTMLALGYLVALLVVAVTAPWLAPYDPNATAVTDRLQGPSAGHLLGTDDLGRDLLSRAMSAAGIALLAAAQAVGLALIVGVPLGLIISHRRGPLERIVLHLADVQQAIPMLLLAFTFAAILGRGLTSGMLAVSVGFAVQYLRLTRAVVLAEQEQPYVEAARVQGYPVGRILFGHVLPNVSGPLIIQTSILIGVAILVEATLSFLGLGVDSRTPSWGGMLQEARRFQMTQPLLILVPGLMVTLTVLAFNTLGDGLADAFGRESPRRRLLARLRDLRRPAPPAPVVVEPAESPSSDDGSDVLLRVRDLRIEVPQERGPALTLVEGVGFDIRAGETFGLVGESGSGKSMTSSAVLGMVPPPAQVTRGSIRFGDQELRRLSATQWATLRGARIGVVFQDPMASLSPLHTVGQQITESLRVHRGLSRRAALAAAADLLARVGVPDPVTRLGDYPHQFSGGMAQRAMIAAALACSPDLLIADEPTTALDATVQKQVLELLRDLQEEYGMAILFITHDLGVVAEICDRVAVMQSGRIVETGETGSILADPQHDYTRSLLAARAAVLGDTEEVVR
jgi:ABC-type dipeptide/oligopeptide/nickel transport system ATPase component/ABC-type dipeptide/oligopeptide/nickel transport system permease subunit